MSLLGTGALAMWWNVHPDYRREFGEWHSREHFPERLSIPGFLRGSRWSSTSDDGDFFVMYELATYETLTSPDYLERLNNPTPWSTKMMPQHRGMIRSQCRVLTSYGRTIAGSLATVRFSPEDGASERLRAAMDGIISASVRNPGVTGAHLLKAETPYAASLTTEQKIRGNDASADWIIILSGYDPAAVQETATTQLGHDNLIRVGAAGSILTNLFCLSFAMTTDDVL